MTRAQDRRLDRAESGLAVVRSVTRTQREMVEAIERLSATASDLAAIGASIAGDLTRELVLGGLCIRSARLREQVVTSTYEPVGLAAEIVSYLPDEVVPDDLVDDLELYLRYEPDEWTHRNRGGHAVHPGYSYRMWARTMLVMAVTDGRPDCLRLREAVEVIDGMDARLQEGVSHELVAPPNSLSLRLVAPLQQVGIPDIFLYLQHVERQTRQAARRP